jgi:hypothetical protein
MSIDKCMRRFRLAARELFNARFRVEGPWNNDRCFPVAQQCAAGDVRRRTRLSAALGIKEKHRGRQAK